MFLFLKGSLVTVSTIAQDLYRGLCPASCPFADWFSYEELTLGPCGPLVCSPVPPGKLIPSSWNYEPSRERGHYRSYKSEEEVGLG